MFYVYILKCSDGSYYTGHTDDLNRRIAEHQNGTFKGFTFYRRPVELLFQQHFSTRDEAFNAEQKIKGWSRKKKEALIRNDWNEIIHLAHETLNYASTSSA